MTAHLPPLGSARALRAAVALAAALWLATSATAQEAQSADAAAAEPSPDQETGPAEAPEPPTAERAEQPAPEPDPVATAFGAAASAIRELLGQTLPLTIEPASLFDVPPTDARAMALEAARLETLLIGETEVPPDVDAEVWNARRELDRMRLAFYRLPSDTRAMLLESHAQRQASDAQARALRESAEALQRAQSAEAERQSALAAAELADSEADRLVVEERARLLGIAAQIAERQAGVARGRSELTEHAERTLALQRQVRDIVTATAAAPENADRLYFELRAWLRASRAELADSLRAPLPEIVVVRRSDSLTTLTIPVDRSEVDTLFDDTVAAAHALQTAEAEHQAARSQQLYDEVQRLNDDRLSLLPFLSREQRDAIVGFGAVGLDQALAELRQVALVLRHHLKIVSGWVSNGAWPAWDGRVASTATANFLQVVFVLIVFLWARRTSKALLIDWRQRLRDNGRRSRRIETGRLDGTIGVTLRILEPLSWLLMVSAVVWVLPTEITTLMEFELLEATLLWSIGGWLAVVAIDQLAMRRARRVGWHGHYRTDAIRLRSLRLVGIAVVAIGLTLTLSERIVGAGTVYSWVLNTCGWMAVPLVLVIVHWWREVIFERMGHSYNRGAFATWVLARKEAPTAVLAATLAGMYLFAKGTVAVTKTWLSSFELTRRLAAQLFRHQLDRMIESGDSETLSPLSAEQLASLSPSTPSGILLRRDDDPQVAEIIQHIDRTGGGIYAVVGERGSGRSTVLRRVSDSRDDVAFVDCPFDGIDALAGSFCRSLELPASTQLEQLAAGLDARQTDLGVIIDNAHRLIRPVMGGLCEFDRLVDIARRHSTRCAWVISMDRLVWRFLARARPVTLLFDDVVELEDWSEENIATLLRNRARQAGIEPRFDRLVPELHTEKDEFERAEALKYAESSYYRLIWDYAGGNPGVALHTWRTSLGVAPDGQIYVNPFRTPDAATFDRLPDSAVFVLRAVLQLERARAADVAKATLVPIGEVESLLRVGVQQGFLYIDGGLHAVTWHWYGPITRFLQRRHLLATS